ncbi:MAG: hypothetical protein V7670_08660 [Maribacter arcticus]
MNAGFGPKYSTTKKKEAFENLFSEIDKVQMNELPKLIGKESLKIVVCTYDALNNRAKFVKSYSASGNGYYSVKLTQAINGSSNAPVQYFDFPARFKAKESDIFYELWAGALGGFNNPILAGIIEAYKLNIPLKEIRIISIGTNNSLMSSDTKQIFWIGNKSHSYSEERNSLFLNGNHSLTFSKKRYFIRLKQFFTNRPILPITLL